MKKIFTISILFIVFILTFQSCSTNNVTKDESLKKYFDEHNVEGCFALYDNGQNHFSIYNLSRFKDSAYSPASTFKIVNSLIGIHTGRIFDEKMVIPWDGVTRKISDWNQDLTMAQAFQYSSVPYYQEVARRIGKDTMQIWLDSLQYGNKKIGKHVDSFWLDNTLKITSDEQLGLVKKIYFQQLNIDKRAQRIVKQVMLRESNSNYQLSYKTGWGSKEDGKSLGWIVGWIEENKHVYFFVLNIEGNKDTSIPSAREKILKGILNQYGFFQGRK